MKSKTILPDSERLTSNEIEHNIVTQRDHLLLKYHNALIVSEKEVEEWISTSSESDFDISGLYVRINEKDNEITNLKQQLTKFEHISRLK